MMRFNDVTWQELQKCIESAEKLGISVSKTNNGTLIVDCGVKASGGIAAGLAMARIGLACLGSASVRTETLGGALWLYVEVQTDDPYPAALLCQAANWPIDTAGCRGMGSGPACLLNKDLSPSQVITDDSSHAVLILEAGSLPDEQACAELATKCGVAPEMLAVMATPTSSLAGSVQIASRSVETALHKLQEMGFDCSKVISGTGICPVAMPTGDDLTAMGRTNDAVLFGSRVWLMVKDVKDEEIEKLITGVPSSTSTSYGKPFLQTLNEAGGFYNIDPGLFAPAEITITNASTGRVWQAGSVDTERLCKALKGL